MDLYEVVKNNNINKVIKFLQKDINFNFKYNCTIYILFFAC